LKGSLVDLLGFVASYGYGIFLISIGLHDHDMIWDTDVFKDLKLGGLFDDE